VFCKRHREWIIRRSYHVFHPGQ